MSDIGVRRRDFEIGRVINRTFGVLAANGGKFAMLGLVLFALPQVGMAFAQLQLYGGGAAPDTGAMDSQGLATFLLFTFGAVVVALILQTILQAAVIHAAVEDLKGRQASIGDSLSTALRYLLPLIGLGILQSIGVVLGLLLLIVPGILLALAWTVIVPSLVVEKTGVFGAFGHSAALTRYFRGSIFLLFLIFGIGGAVVFGLMTLIASMILSSVAGDVGQSAIWMTTFVEPFINALSAVFGAVGVAAIYFELRWVKSSPEAGQELAAIFD